jgi:peptidoglycan/LPS O-acetylase OafA/YrhL
LADAREDKAGMGRSATLGEALRGRDNALNLVRLLLAVGVIVSHTWPLGGFGSDPGFGDQSLGGWSVAGFFAISGYLIPQSRQRCSLSTYAIRRGLRILPGLWVCLIVVAFGLAPLAALASRVEYDVSAAARYALTNATTVYLVGDVGPELDGLPYPGVWNGSLWTLQYEVLCYLVASVVVSRSDSWLRCRSLTAVVALGAVGTLHDGPFLSVLAYFGAGWLLGVLRDKVCVSWWLAVVAGVSLAGVVATGARPSLTAPAVAYLVLALGAASPLRWGAATDLSYGVYIYAFPVQQLLALAGVQRAGALAFLGASLAATLAIAWVSWSLVESPALRLAHKVPPDILRTGSQDACPAEAAPSPRRPTEATAGRGGIPSGGR